MCFLVHVEFWILVEDLVLTLQWFGFGTGLNLFILIAGFCVASERDRAGPESLFIGDFETGTQCTFARKVLGQGLCVSFDVAILENDRVIGRLGRTSFLHETVGVCLGWSEGVKLMDTSTPLGNTFDNVSSFADPEPQLELDRFGLVPQIQDSSMEEQRK